MKSSYLSSLLTMPFFYLHWRSKLSKVLLDFKDKHRGESCVIIGNGPSLNKMDLSLLRNLNTFGLNKIYLLLKKVDLNLTYHVAVNKYVIDQSIQDFQKMTCPSFIPICSQGSQNENYFSPNVLPISCMLPKCGTHSKKVFFQNDLTKDLGAPPTVTFTALQIAYYMGFKKVFLIGVDHRFKSEGKPNSLVQLSDDDENHFSPDYFKNEKWQLPDLKGSERAYSKAKEFYESSGRFIYDATVDGALNIFPKVAYKEAIKICSSSP